MGKRKLEHVLSGLNLFSLLLKLKEVDPEHTDLLASLRSQDLSVILGDFEAEAAIQVRGEELRPEGSI